MMITWGAPDAAAPAAGGVYAGAANAAAAAGLRPVKGPEKRYLGGGFWERWAGGGNSEEAGGV